MKISWTQSSALGTIHILEDDPRVVAIFLYIGPFFDNRDVTPCSVDLSIRQRPQIPDSFRLQTPRHLRRLSLRQDEKSEDRPHGLS
jgi:hypothetical protein